MQMCSNPESPILIVFPNTADYYILHIQDFQVMSQQEAQESRKKSEARKYYVILRDILKVYYKPYLDMDDPMEYNVLFNTKRRL